MPNSLAQAIERMLADAMDNFIAAVTIKKNCELIGTTTEQLTVEELPALAQKIEKSVALFKDEATAKDLAERITALRCPEAHGIDLTKQAGRSDASRGYTYGVGGWKWEMAVQSSHKMRS